MLRDVLARLWADGGERPARDGEDDVLGVLIRMVLAQATSRDNASRAFGELLDTYAGDWDRVRNAPLDELAAAIAVGGLSNQKAPRIQSLLRRVKADFGEYTLEPLRELEADRAQRYLISLDGVGPTTARFALMYAAGFDVFPVNGGIRRVLERVGVLDGSESSAEAHRLAQEAISAGDAYAAHMTLVRHARNVCRKEPKCLECAARDVCAFATVEKGADFL